MLIYFLCVLKLVCLITHSEGAKILATVFTPSYSHQVTFRPLWIELAKRGHDILLLTTDPMDLNLKNIKEIDLRGSYEIMEKYGASKLVSNSKGLGYKQFFDAYLLALSKTADWQLNQTEVQKLIRNQGEHFDLIMTEMMFPTHLGFVDRFKAPFIGLFSHDALLRVHKVIGNFIHPVAYPDYIFPFKKNLNFFQRVLSTITVEVIDIYSNFIYKREDKTVKKHFGNYIRPLNEIEQDINLMFINVHPLFHQLRPFGPNTIQIGGGTHLKNPQVLPQDIKKFLDSSQKGVIYFSLGTNVKASLISKELTRIILDTFASLPYLVLWKFEEENLLRKPKNVKIKKWFPQQDLLQHPKVVLFITQCGLQSIEESIYSQVPMIGMPFFGDQPRNANIMEENGLGLSVNIDNLTKEAFQNAITEVISNPSYKKKVAEIAGLIKDVEMTGLEKAVWWTEYAIRTKGGKHLRNPIVDMPFYKFYLLDVIGFLFVIIAMYLYFCMKITKLLVILLFSKKTVSQSKSE